MNDPKTPKAPLLCIYCDDPDYPSDSHVIPESLGKGPVLRGAVCRKCNSAFSKAVEQDVAKSLSFYRWAYGIGGKRGNRPRTPVHVVVDQGSASIRVRDLYELRNHPLALTRTSGADGQERLVGFLGATEGQLKSYVSERLAPRYPNAKWEFTQLDPGVHRFEVHYLADYGVFARPAMRRVAAKVALEWWCLQGSPQRDPTDLKTRDYDYIREFVSKNPTAERSPVSLVTDERIMAALSVVPPGFHALVTACRPTSRNLVVLVGIYSLAFYRVVLRRNWLAIAVRDDITLINPQTGHEQAPPLRARVGPGPDYCSDRVSDQDDPNTAITKIDSWIQQRLRQMVNPPENEARDHAG